MATVYSWETVLATRRKVALHGSPPYNIRLRMEGLEFLSRLNDSCIPAAFFDPQYRGIMDKMKYGNEGSRQKLRAAMPQMSEETITSFVREIARVLVGSGHLFLWIDKFHLCEGVHAWLSGTDLSVVDLITWDKGRMGMGYRTRRKSEHLVVLQKKPTKAKGVWKLHNIPDVVTEKVTGGRKYAHQKPVILQQMLMEAITNKRDIVIDPAAGSFSVMEAAMMCGRRFLGCDIALGDTEWRE